MQESAPTPVPQAPGDPGAPTAPRPDALYRAAVALGDRLGFEAPHALHVTTLTMGLFGHLLPVLPRRVRKDPRAARVLLVASILHDVGCTVEYRAHHKHSRRIILTRRVRGLTPDELVLAALVARYHRKSAPQARHAGYAGLGRSDRALVRVLAGLLRVGDGLDRQHLQRVRLVRAGLRATPRTGRVLTLTVAAPRRPTPEIAASRSKSDVLARALRCSIRYRFVSLSRATLGA